MKTLTRRHVLRGAGVALALPWLESLEPRRAQGQAAAPRRRFVPVFFPLGTADFWTPKGVGAGDAWQLSPILEPLTPIKDRVTVLGHVADTAYGNGPPEPSKELLTGSFLTCAPCQLPPTALRNGISVDQRIAQALRGSTHLDSLQVGLSTDDTGYIEGVPAPYARSISWSSPDEPMFKVVSPQSVFDQLVNGAPPARIPDPAVAALRAARKSVLDYVVGNAASLQSRLGHTDRARLDEFLTSVRDLEQRVTQPPPLPPPACVTLTRPSLSVGVDNLPPGYSRDDHANLMVDLIVMALSCDHTRVASFMLDDARSFIIYDFLQLRNFTDDGSSPGAGVVGGYVNVVEAGVRNDAYATITWWFVTKLARLCQKLAAVDDGGGESVLDNSVVWFGSGWQRDSPTNLPLLYVGSGGGVLKVDQSIDFTPKQKLSNVYLTFLRHVFGIADAAFGDSTGVVSEVLA